MTFAGFCVRVLILSLVLPRPELQAQSFPDYPSLLASEPGSPAAAQLQELDDALRRAFNAKIDVGRPPAAAAAFRESPIESLLQSGNETVNYDFPDLSPASVLGSGAAELLGGPLSCPQNPLALPDSLAGAMNQIEEVAARVHDQFNELASARNFNRMRRYHDDATAILQSNPFGGDLTRREARTLRRYFRAMDSVDLHALTCAALSWARLTEKDWLMHLRELMSAHGSAQSAVILERDTEWGTILLAGSASGSLLRQNVLFIADLGGDDIYGIEASAPFSGIPQLIIDFSGNDRYESSRGSNIAGGMGSVSILLDLDGDDLYDGPALTQGAAIFGVGLLMDSAGNDTYRAGTLAQGYGMYGTGLLLDRTGDDSYQLQALGQGLGMASGLGALVDRQGHDQYVARGAIPTNYGTPGLTDAWAQGVGLGVRDMARGGTGRLVDGAGSDRFDAGSFAMGGGYYLGFGEFLNSGNESDSYLGSRYNFGWGAHGGIGRFQEAGGNDRYRTRQIVAAGLAWDRSLALFRDEGGDDVYDMGDFSLGASALGSAALFIDGGGADHYHGVSPARANQEPPNLSLFLDIGPEQNDLDNRILAQACRYRGSLSIILLAASHDDANLDDCLSTEN